MRQYLKGLAKLRRRFIGSSGKLVEVENTSVYDRFGDRLEDVRVFKTVRDYEGNPWDHLQQLGSGHFSRVFAIDDTRVLKVVTNKGGDAGYAAFVDMCLANQHNPHLPRIYYRGRWGAHTVYVLERMTPPSDHELVDRLNEALEACGKATENPFLSLPCPKLAELARLLADRPDTVRGYCDLKYDNTMQRADGTLVITDAWVSAW